MKKIMCSVIAAGLLQNFAMADIYSLGVVSVEDNVTNPKKSVFEETTTSQDIALQNVNTVSEALDNMSGISRTAVGARGESGINLRGFDAKRVGIFMDGIPVYVPYDGNFDFARFLTMDIGRIDVSKGYSSVIYGANTMGGAINIISKKPTKLLEGEIKTGLVLDSDGKQSSYETYLNLGTKQDNFYAQLNAMYNDQDHTRLSDDFIGSSSQPKGERLRSEATDRKVSLKTGYINDNNDELSLNYINQHGVKQQPPSVNKDYSMEKYWDWPFWDKETISLSGQKNFENSFVKLLAYHDTFNNSLYGYDDAAYATMNTKKSFKSEYNDRSNGARLEYGYYFENHFVDMGIDYKQDAHRGYDIDKITNAKTLAENYKDHTVSFGIEDAYKINDKLELFAGANYICREADKIFDTNPDYKVDDSNRTTQHAFNPEAALVYSLDDMSKIRGSIAKKTYLPSMKDRYSRKFEQYKPNPDLKNEETIHYELSYQKNTGHFDYKAGIFYAKVDDAIQSIYTGEIITNKYGDSVDLQQNQNVGSFEHKGIELESNYKNDGIEAGANYTFLDIDNKNNTAVKMTYVPKHEIFGYVKKDIGYDVALYVDFKFRNGAYQQKMTTKAYDMIPSFTIFDAKAMYEPTKAITLEAGVKNIGDKLYYYDLAFPEAGREYFFTASYKF